MRGEELRLQELPAVPDSGVPRRSETSVDVDLAAFPTEAAPRPEPPPEPDIIIYKGAEFHFAPGTLEQFCRFTVEQKTAVEAMRLGGISEETIAEAFPPRQGVPRAEAIVTPAAEGQHVARAPEAPPPPAAPARPYCPHIHQRLNKRTGDILCADCGWKISGGSGFVDNRNPGWNGMSRQGAVNPRAGVRVLGQGQQPQINIYAGQVRDEW